jgi:hypothetical protein
VGCRAARGACEETEVIARKPDIPIPSETSLDRHPQACTFYDCGRHSGKDPHTIRQSLEGVDAAVHEAEARAPTNSLSTLTSARS